MRIGEKEKNSSPFFSFSPFLTFRSRASLSISLLKHYVIASQSHRRLGGRPLYHWRGGYTASWDPCGVINKISQGLFLWGRSWGSLCTFIQGGTAGKSEKASCPEVKFPNKVDCPGVRFSKTITCPWISSQNLCIVLENC